MQPLIRIATGTASAALLAFATNVRADVVETRELAETIAVPADAPLVVIVKNIIGPIRVTGHDGSSVEMRATETVRGDLQADIERARAEMQLRTESEPGRVAFRVRSIGEDGELATIIAAGAAGTATASSTTSRCACRATPRSRSRRSTTAT